jgi:hypothetical protein
MKSGKGRSECSSGGKSVPTFFVDDNLKKPTSLVLSLLPSAIAFLFIMLFTYASLAKLIDAHTFYSQLVQSPMLSNYAGLIVWAVPLVELSICILLSIEKARLSGLYLSFGLMIVFTTYIFLGVNYYENPPCSCGGIIEKMTWNEHLIFNLVFVALAIVGVLFHDNASAAIRATRRTPGME